MRTRGLARAGIALAAWGVVIIASASPGMAQTAAPPAAAPAPASTPAPTREALQQQLDAQNARNDQLRQRIAKLEEVLKTDVCSNPEAEALLKAEQQATPR